MTIFEFGEFRLDCGRFELLRNGRSLRVERKPLELLILLAEKNGQLATREEIAQRLWQSEVFVDTEHGINTAIRKIRYTLRDDAEESRFIQTVTGKGYRFVAPVQILAEVEPRLLRAAENGVPSLGPADEPVAPPATPKASDAAFGQSIERRSGISRRTWIVAGATAGLALLAGAAFGVARWSQFRSQAAAISSLAVLPLDNLSGDPNQEYFADGMTDELTTMLAKDSTLRITSRTSVMQYKRVHKPLGEIARALHVDGIVEGSVARSGNHVHLTLQLIRAATDSHLWAESYDRDTNDVALPDEAARSIAKRLNTAASALASTRYVNPAAHDAYLRGKYLWFGHGVDSGQYFRKAIEIQPDYAMGWAWLSMYYGQGSILGYLDPRESLGPEYEAAARAIQLDPGLPDAHLAMSSALFFDKWDFPGADREIQQAINLDPHAAEFYYLRAKMLGALNRNEEAIENAKKSMELDPFARPWALLAVYRTARQWDAAMREARLQLEATQNNVAVLGQTEVLYEHMGRYKEALEYGGKWREIVGDAAAARESRSIFQQSGFKGIVRWRLATASTEEARKKDWASLMDLAKLHAQLGERETTLALLERAFQQRVPDILYIQTDPAYDFLHADPRYRSLVQRMGLPPTY